MIKKTAVKGSDTVKVSFVLPEAHGPDKVSVVGDFNGWDPFAHPLRRRRNGTRSVTVSLEPGRRYAFRYLGDGGHWLNDDSVPAEPNGAGGVNNVILI